MYYTDTTTQQTFISFVLSYVTLSVIAGLFTYRLLNSFLYNILLPIIDLTLLPDRKFHKLSKMYNYKKEKIEILHDKNDYKYIIKPGIFLKELIIWSIAMIILYIIYSFTNKQK